MSNYHMSRIQKKDPRPSMTVECPKPISPSGMTKSFGTPTSPQVPGNRFIIRPSIGSLAVSPIKMPKRVQVTTPKSPLTEELQHSPPQISSIQMLASKTLANRHVQREQKKPALLMNAQRADSADSTDRSIISVDSKNNVLGEGYAMFMDPWKIEYVAGRGQFATVYAAKNLKDGKMMAVKQLPITMNSNIQEMIDEVVLMCRASFRNPHVVQCLGWSVSDSSNVPMSARDPLQYNEMNIQLLVGGFFNIFMEFLPRGSLASYMKTNGPLDEMTARKFLRQLLLGVRSLHAAGIAHRDIKCQNLLISETNVIKVADFGCATKIAGTDASQPNAIIGSVPWMSPEVIKQQIGDPGDPSSSIKGWKLADVWSIGCVLIEMLTGDPPWNNYSNPAAMMFAIAMSKSGPPIPDSVLIRAEGKDFVQQCFALNAQDRPKVANLLYHDYVRRENIETEQE